MKTEYSYTTLADGRDVHRLIVAAPDMLDALKQIAANACMYHAETIAEIARAAIAKATGGAA